MKKNNFGRYFNMTVLNFVFFLALSAVFMYVSVINNDSKSEPWLIFVLFLMMVINITVFFIKRKTLRNAVSQLSFYIGDGEKFPGSISGFQLPLLFLNEYGELICYNQLFSDIIPKNESIKKTSKRIYELKIRNKIESNVSDLSATVELYGKTFNMLGSVAKLKEDKFCIMLYFVDMTNFINLEKIHKNGMVAIGEVAIDSYEEIYQSSGESVANQVTVELNKLFEKWLEGKNAIIRKLVRDRYIIMIEYKYLQEIEKKKFEILNWAKNINVGNKIPVTLSIGLSMLGQSVQENLKNSEDAVELALGRGGDQAIVRIEGEDTYYGGSNIEMERRTKVKARVVANLIEQEIEKSSRVLVMGHENCDMDSLGSALAIYRFATLKNKKAKIILNSVNQSIEEMMKKINTMPEYEDVFINTSHALNLIDNDTLVVVVDTYTQNNTECPKLLDYSPRIIVIDHHRRGANYIKNTVLFYSETYASSTSELLIEILKHFQPNILIPRIEAEAMYSGIWVDTKNFTFKTGTRTFEAASFLRSQGVDTVSVRKYFQPDYETFSKICAVTSSAKVISSHIAIAKCVSETKNTQFIAALAADQMLNVAEVKASFVLSQMNNMVYISARSFGEINVQVILERMGGGGHLTSSGAKLADITIDQAEKTLIKHIEDYLSN